MNAFPTGGESEGKHMVTISDIMADVERGIQAYNMIEDKFSYRIIYYINFGNKGTKFRVDTSYDGLRKSLENIIRGHLTTENNIVLAAITTRKNGKSVPLLSRSYSFSLGEYFRKICEEKENEYLSNNYGRRRVQWY